MQSIASVLAHLPPDLGLPPGITPGCRRARELTRRATGAAARR